MGSVTCLAPYDCQRDQGVTKPSSREVTMERPSSIERGREWIWGRDDISDREKSEARMKRDNNKQGKFHVTC